MIKHTAAALCLLSSCLVLGTGCNTNQEIPLAKVPEPPKLPAQDKSKVKPPVGHSPDVLPQ